MPDSDLGTFIAQALDIAAIGGVGTLHGIAEVDEHLRDAAHANAADANEVNWTDVARQFHRLYPLCGTPAIGTRFTPSPPRAAPNRPVARRRRPRPASGRPRPLLRAFEARWQAR